MGRCWQLEPGRGGLDAYRWWVRGCETCRSYQNCASRRDSHGQGSQAAQLGLTQLILVFPSGVLSSTGRCFAMRRGLVSVVDGMGSLLLGGTARHAGPGSALPGFRRLPLARAGCPARAVRHCHGTSQSRLRSQTARSHGDTPRADPRRHHWRRPEVPRTPGHQPIPPASTRHQVGHAGGRRAALAMMARHVAGTCLGLPAPERLTRPGSRSLA